MADVVHFHIGAPKTGTTYLQDRLHRNVSRLVDHGVTYPVEANRAHFHAAMDLAEKDWVSVGSDKDGQWDALAERVRRTDGRVIISHEIFAEAPQRQIDKAMQDLGGAEVHIVYSQRDMARQIPAQYQESAKHQRSIPFSRWVEQCMTSSRRDSEWWFWRAHSLPDVLERWGKHVPPERVHLVTVPQRGHTGEDLFQRYCRALSIDTAWLPEDSIRRNESLGIDETIFLQRLNKRLVATELPRKRYDNIVRGLLIQRNLSKNPPARRITMPPWSFDWIDEVSQEWIDWVHASGIHVVGDVEDFRVARPDPTQEWADPDEPDFEIVADTALAAVEVLVMELAKRRGGPGAPASPARRLARRAGLGRLRARVNRALDRQA